MRKNPVGELGWGGHKAGEPSAPGHRREGAQRGSSPHPLGGMFRALNSGPIVEMGTLRWTWQNSDSQTWLSLGSGARSSRDRPSWRPGTHRHKLTGPASGTQHWEHPETQQGAGGNWIWNLGPGHPGDSCRTSVLLPAKLAAGPSSPQPLPGPARAGSCRATAIQLWHPARRWQSASRAWRWISWHQECLGQACARGLA